MKILLVRLEKYLEQLGPIRSSAVMTLAVVLAVLMTHTLLRLLEGEPLSLLGSFNVALDIVLVAAPLIFYSRRARARLEDMSRRMAHAAEEAREASRAKSAFLANMSHELRTPLNAILGFSEIMKDQHLGPLQNPRYLTYAADIHASGRHLLGIINDILDLAKIEAGKMSLDGAAEFDLVPALSASLAMLKGLGDKHGVAVRGEWDDEAVRLFAVERMVRQIVINLVGNGIKFTPQGGSVVLSGAPEPDGGFCLKVRDDGIGMNAGEMVNALTPFGQNRVRAAVRQEGTGLGLPLAKAMMELHGGSLTLESRPNQGTCVSLRFPAQRVVKPREQKAA
ncbi:MAG TPA: HAMP domain-containing sensor histidine kinase [Rhizomicrobium sp.]|nr:HAMP domain-containing sensor histidine kinase [Rhizomicrobium sp.]